MQNSTQVESTEESKYRSSLFMAKQSRLQVVIIHYFMILHYWVNDPLLCKYHLNVITGQCGANFIYLGKLLEVFYRLIKKILIYKVNKNKYYSCHINVEK